MLFVGGPRQKAGDALFELYDMPDGSVLAWMFITGTPHWEFFEDRREFTKAAHGLVAWVAGDLGPWRFRQWVRKQRRAANLKQQVGADPVGGKESRAPDTSIDDLFR